MQSVDNFDNNLQGRKGKGIGEATTPFSLP